MAGEVVEQFKQFRTPLDAHPRSCLAHHTTGAGRDTVAQLCFQDSEEWDRRMLLRCRTASPLSRHGLEDKVTAAMISSSHAGPEAQPAALRVSFRVEDAVPEAALPGAGGPEGPA